MFIYNGNINMLHGFSFLDAIIDEYGNIKNKVVFELIKKSGIYNVYNHANFLVNSEYTYNLSKKMFPLLGIKPDMMEILYIPVTVNKNVDLSLKDKKLVISIGRINVRKNYEQLIEIAKKLSDYKFVIAGALNSGDEDYYKNLIKNKSSNLEIKINISEEEKINLLKKASIYVHLNRRENYGISILEAMSYGLIPVVPEVGGPWIDIINKGEYGYGFKNIDEAVDDIKNVDFGIINNMMNSLDRFSYDRFNIRINDTVSNVRKA
jgi:glycosyltransferase involved in cell wall biosynthesis